MSSHARGGAVWVLVAVVIGTAIWVNAGDLTPPAGPVAPTMKTLDEVEARIPIGPDTTPGDADSVFRITSRGSYYLTANVDGQAGKSGIEIAARGVTCDLNGFEVLGVTGSLDGISIGFTSIRNVAVVNGSLLKWGNDGVDLSDATNVHVENLRVSENGGTGIVAGPNAIVRVCITHSNGGAGIRIGDGSMVTDSTALGNTGAGIQIGEGAAVYRCTAGSNGVNGIDGDKGSAVSDCVVRMNTEIGIHVMQGSKVSDCTVHDSGTIGILAVDNCSVTNCMVSSSGEDGIFTFSGSTISGCTVDGNTGDGIEVQRDCRVVGNTCYLNGLGAGNGAGIHVSGSGRVRVEGNDVSTNDRGIDVDFAGSVIIRNTATSNTTNYDIAAANFTGAIITTVGGMSTANNANVNIGF